MIRKSKPASPEIEKAVGKALGYEVTISDLAMKSQKRAWYVAGFSLFVTLVMAGAIFYMLPLKEKEPYILVLDPVTGNTQISRLVTDARDSWVYENQAYSRSNIHRFIFSRESYDYELMINSVSGDWKLPFLMSTGSVSAELRALWGTSNPASPLNVYGMDRAVRIRIQSIIMERDARPGSEGAATVRFQRLLFDKKSGSTRVIDSKIAMMEFTYNPSLNLSDTDRVQNPLGFQVTTYRVENDGAAASLPPEVMLQPAPQVPAVEQMNYPMPGVADAVGQPEAALSIPDGQQGAPGGAPAAGGVPAPQQGEVLQ